MCPKTSDNFALFLDDLLSMDPKEIFCCLTTTQAQGHAASAIQTATVVSGSTGNAVGKRATLERACVHNYAKV